MIQHRKKNKKGFTLIELLVVIAIIGLLATIVMVSLNIARDKAKTAKIVADFKTIEKALFMLLDAEGKTAWWRETDKSTNLSAFSGLATYLKAIPASPISGNYAYDNDGDTLLTPDASCCRGVNIGVENCGSSCQKYFFLVDQLVDRGDDRGAGKIRSDSSYSYIYYNIAVNETTF